MRRTSPPSALMRTTATTFPNAPRGQFVPHDGGVRWTTRSMPATGGPTLATRRPRSPRGQGTCAPHAARPPFEHAPARRRCDSSEQALPIDSARNQALVAEHLAYVVDVGVRVGQDEVAGLQRVDGQRL